MLQQERVFKMANEGLLIGLNEAIPQAIRGFYDAEDRRYRRLEMEAKLKAQEENQRRQSLLDEYELSKNSPERRMEQMRFELAKGGQEAVFDDSGNFVSARYRPDTMQRSRAGGPDSLGALKQLQLYKARREADQAEKGFKLPPDKVLLVQQGAQLPRQLEDIQNTLATNEGKFDPIKGFFETRNPYSSDSQIIDAQLRAAAQNFGRYMEGGVLRKEDEDKYRKMFPQMTDTKDVAQGKLDIVRRLLTQKHNADIQALSDQGYDVSGFNALQEGELPDSLRKKSVVGLIKPGLLNKAKGLIEPAAQAQPKVDKEDEQAIEWARKNPKDPRSKQILELHGM